MSKKSMAPLVICVVALSLICVAGVVGIGQHLWLSKAEIVDGVVTELVESRTSKGGRVYRPTVAFRTLAGESREITNASASSPPSFEIGEHVKVAYDLGSGEGRILTFARRFGVAAVLVGIGVGMLVTLGIFKVGEKMVPGLYMKGSATVLPDPPVERE
jgi:hypothetical protein